jgi:pimeloyl-ACP methyl ester carboxylesterase
MPYVIVPIHGTWARKAKWIQPGSPLLSCLSKELGGAVVEPFLWSGKNSHNARRRAAEDLRTHIGKLTMNIAGSQIVVIAHSHGGTVALYAVEDTKTLVNVAGLICLSTPFISVNSAPLSGSLPAFFPTLLASTFAIVYALVLHPRDVVTIFTSSLVTRDVAQYLNVACAFALVCILTRQSVLAGERAVEDLDVTPDPSLPLLIMRCSGDEASAALATSQFFTWITRRFWQTCTSLATLMGAYFEKNGPLESFPAFLTVWGILVISTVAGIVFLGGPGQVSAKYDVQLSSASSLLVALPLGLCEITLLIGGYANACFILAELLFKGISMIAHAAGALFLLPFGPELGQAGLVADISVEASPRGYWGVYQVQPVANDRGSSGRSFTYLHSLVYEHVDAINEMLRWIIQNAKQTRQ